MKRILLAAVAALALVAGPALAADLPGITGPVKAPPVSGFPTGCGLYFGVNTVGTAAPVTGAPVGTSVIGGAIGLDVGYTCPIGTAPGSFWFAEGMFDIQNLNGSANGLSVTGPVHFEQRLGIGGPLLPFVTQLVPGLGSISTPSLPVLPAGVTQGPSYPYFYAALNEDDISAQFMLGNGKEWLFAPEGGLGMRSRLSNQVMADVWAGVKMQTSAICVGPLACPKISAGPAVGFKFDY